MDLVLWQAEPCTLQLVGGRILDMVRLFYYARASIFVHVTIHRRLRIGRDGHPDQSEANDVS